MSVYRRSLSIVIPVVLLFLISSARLAQAQTSADSSLRLKVDTPGRTATVEPPFLVAGWALDLRSVSGPNVDAVHVWAFPVNGPPISWARRRSTSRVPTWLVCSVRSSRGRASAW